MEDDNRPKVISLFSGAGGDTLGLEMAGFNVVAFAEWWKVAIETHLENFPDSKLIGDGDVTKIGEAELKDYIGNIDLIFAGFPCQGFSTAGKRDINDKRNKLFYEFLRIVDIIKPEWVIGENVIGLQTMKTDDGFNNVADEIIREFNNIGYYMEKKILCAADYGAPTIRRRLIFIGRRFGNKIRYPKPTHYLKEQTTIQDKIDYYDDLKNKKSVQTYITVRQAINNLPNYTDRFLTLKMKRKINMLKNGALKLSSYNTGNEILNANKPMFAILATDTDYIHPFYDRFLNVDELKVLQSFPLSYEFHGNRQQVIKQIGNSVPPLLAKAIGECILNMDKNIEQKDNPISIRAKEAQQKLE